MCNAKMPMETDVKGDTTDCCVNSLRQRDLLKSPAAFSSIFLCFSRELS